MPFVPKLGLLGGLEELDELDELEELDELDELEFAEPDELDELEELAELGLGLLLVPAAFFLPELEGELELREGCSSLPKLEFGVFGERERSPPQSEASGRRFTKGSCCVGLRE